MFAKWLVLWIDLTEVYNYQKGLEMCICLWPEFDCPEVTLCGWQDIKIQLLTNYWLLWPWPLGEITQNFFFFKGLITDLPHAKLSFYLL